jgi:hypothetical protein
VSFLEISVLTMFKYVPLALNIWATLLSEQHFSGLEGFDFCFQSSLKYIQFLFLDKSRNDDFGQVAGPLPVGLAAD